jgi:hypothetical protein
MRDAEKTIERLLAGLRDAEPPCGIEHRILKALDGMDAREASASASLWRWSLRPAIAVLLAGVVILMAGIAVQQRRHAPPVLTSAHVRQPAKRELVARAPTVLLRTTSRVPVKPRQDAPAVGNTQAAGFPAPPLPLTEQERLLLRLAQRGDADNKAMLNPDARAALTAKTTKQFQQFFAIDATEMRSQSE